MTQPRVTVIVPNYNYGHFIQGRIESILDQTVKDIEVIWIDDASTDNSRVVMSSYSENPRIRLMINEVNHGGPFFSWNRGVEDAKAEYVWIAEADDLSDRMFLERMLHVLDHHPTVGIVYCQSTIIDEQNRVTGSLMQWMEEFDSDRWRTSFIENGLYESRTMFCRFCEIANVSSAVFRREAYIMSGGADESLRLTGDWKLYLHMLRNWDIAYIADELNYFRNHSGSVRSTVAKSGQDVVERYSLAASTFPSLKLRTPYREMAFDAMLDSWLMCSSTLWSRNHRPLHFRIYELARSVDPGIGKRTLGRVFSSCGFAALKDGDRRAAYQWFIDAARFDWRILLNRGVLSVISKHVFNTAVQPVAARMAKSGR